MTKEKFTYREKLDIYEALKDLWRSSDTITYKGLENIQLKEWGGIAFKWTTLRNRASKEGWNKEKGINISKILEERKNEILESGEGVEILQGEQDEYSQILKGIERKYRPDFEKVRVKLQKAIDTEDTKGLRHIKTAIDTIESARALDLKLSGHLDVPEYRKLEMEILKLEIMTIKTESMFEPVEGE